MLRAFAASDSSEYGKLMAPTLKNKSLRLYKIMEEEKRNVFEQCIAEINTIE